MADPSALRIPKGSGINTPASSSGTATPPVHNTARVGNNDDEATEHDVSLGSMQDNVMPQGNQSQYQSQDTTEIVKQSKKTETMKNEEVTESSAVESGEETKKKRSKSRKSSLSREKDSSLIETQRRTSKGILKFEGRQSSTHTHQCVRIDTEYKGKISSQSSQGGNNTIAQEGITTKQSSKEGAVGGIATGEAAIGGDKATVSAALDMARECLAAINETKGGAKYDIDKYVKDHADGPELALVRSCLHAMLTMKLRTDDETALAPTTTESTEAKGSNTKNPVPNNLREEIISRVTAASQGRIASHGKKKRSCSPKRNSADRNRRSQESKDDESPSINAAYQEMLSRDVWENSTVSLRSRGKNRDSLTVPSHVIKKKKKKQKRSQSIEERYSFCPGFKPAPGHRWVRRYFGSIANMGNYGSYRKAVRTCFKWVQEPIPKRKKIHRPHWLEHFHGEKFVNKHHFPPYVFPKMMAPMRHPYESMNRPPLKVVEPLAWSEEAWTRILGIIIDSKFDERLMLRLKSTNSIEKTKFK